MALVVTRQFDPLELTDPSPIPSGATGEAEASDGLDITVNAILEVATIDAGKGEDARRVSSFHILSNSLGKFGIPATSTIISATLTYFAANTQSDAFYSVTYSIMPKDGKWDRIGITEGWESFQLFGGNWKSRYHLRDFAGATISQSTPGSGDSGPIVRHDEFGWQRIGITVDASGGPHTLGTIEMRIKRFGSHSPDRNIVCRVYQVTDPTISPSNATSGKPIGTFFAQSALISFNGLSTLLDGADITFDFGNSVTLVDGLYHFAVSYAEGDDIIDTVNHFQLRGLNSGSGDPHPFWFGRDQGLRWKNYPTEKSLPHHLLDDGSVNITPLATQARIKPAQTNNNAVASNSIVTLIQNYIDTGAYDPDDAILLCEEGVDPDTNKSWLSDAAIESDPDNPFLTVSYSIPIIISPLIGIATMTVDGKIVKKLPMQAGIDIKPVMGAGIDISSVMQAEIDVSPVMGAKIDTTPVTDAAIEITDVMSADASIKKTKN